MNSIEDYQRELATQRKSREVAELQLEEKSRDLFEKNRSLQSALRQLNVQQQQIIAQEKSASVGQLSAGLAHEINNPNAFVISNINTLSDYVYNLTHGFDAVSLLILEGDLASESVKGSFREILKKHDVEYIKQDIESLIEETEQGALRIKRIIKGLQYFSHQDPKQKKKFDLVQCLKKSIALLENEREIIVSFECDIRDLPIYEGVPSLISQALINIFRNSAESNPKSKHVFVSAEVIGAEIVIRIKDDGEGIAIENLQKVFDPFYTTKPHVNGLGLTISQAIIKQHEGYVDISSNQNVETIVTIHLPVIEG